VHHEAIRIWGLQEIEWVVVAGFDGGDITLRIPTQGGQVFRSDRGQPTDLMAATIPI
jgi:hypothetical protein